MAHNSDGAPEAENNRQSTPASSQNAAARGSADYRECCPAPLLPPGGLVLHHGSHSRLALVPEEAAAGFSFWRVYMPQRTRPWAVPRITCRHCRARTGPGGRSARGEADQASRQRSRRLLCEAPEYLSARGASSRRQQARRLSLARTVPPVAGLCSACTGTARRAGTSGISYGPQVRTSHTSRSSPPLPARAESWPGGGQLRGSARAPRGRGSPGHSGRSRLPLATPIGVSATQTLSPGRSPWRPDAPAIRSTGRRRRAPSTRSCSRRSMPAVSRRAACGFSAVQFRISL